MPCYDCHTTSLMRQAYAAAYADAEDLGLLHGRDHSTVCAALAKAILKDGEAEAFDPRGAAVDAVASVARIRAGAERRVAILKVAA